MKKKKRNDEMKTMWKTELIHKIYQTKRHDKEKSVGVQL